MKIKYLEERKRLKQFKKDIVGIFDDWEVTRYNLSNEKYSLWIANGYSNFNDCKLDNKELFLAVFTPKERKILWKEFKKRNSSRNSLLRAEIFKKFNLQ